MAGKKCLNRGCPRFTSWNDICPTCYQAWEQAGRPAFLPPPPPLSTICIVPGCGRTARAQGTGVCKNCHFRWKYAGFPAPGPSARAQPINVGRTCIAPGCGRPAYIRGACTGCYQRWRRAGRPPQFPPPRDPINAGKTCSVLWCDRPAHARSWCKPCYLRWLRAEQPAEGPPPLWRNATNRFEDYCWLRDNCDSIEESASRVGIGLHTAHLYEKRRRQAVAA
jgi:hypothetical protein